MVSAACGDHAHDAAVSAECVLERLVSCVSSCCFV